MYLIVPAPPSLAKTVADRSTSLLVLYLLIPQTALSTALYYALYGRLTDRPFVESQAVN